MSNVVSLNTLRKPVRRIPAREAHVTLHGSLQVVSPPDLVQWLCCANKSHKVHLWGPDLEGELVVSQGELVDASANGLRGMDALVAILDHPNGSFELLPLTSAPTQTLHGPWQSLVLSAAQRIDERGHDFEETPRTREDIPPLSTEPTTPPMLFALPGLAHEPPANDGATVTELVDQGFAALRTGNTQTAKDLWLRALQMEPDNKSIRFNLRKLEERGPAK